MRILSTALLGMALAFNVAAEDKVKDKGKVETIDPVTGQKEKTKYKTKGESDGKSVEKTESKGPEGKSKSKTKVKADDDGDYKEKTKGKGPDGKYETKTKIDR